MLSRSLSGKVKNKKGRNINSEEMKKKEEERIKVYYEEEQRKNPINLHPMQTRRISIKVFDEMVKSNEGIVRSFAFVRLYVMKLYDDLKKWEFANEGVLFLVEKVDGCNLSLFDPVLFKQDKKETVWKYNLFYNDSDPNHSNKARPVTWKHDLDVLYLVLEGLNEQFFAITFSHLNKFPRWEFHEDLVEVVQRRIIERKEQNENNNNNNNNILSPSTNQQKKKKKKKKKMKKMKFSLTNLSGSKEFMDEFEKISVDLSEEMKNAEFGDTSSSTIGGYSIFSNFKHDQEIERVSSQPPRGPDFRKLRKLWVSRRRMKKVHAFWRTIFLEMNILNNTYRITKQMLDRESEHILMNELYQFVVTCMGEYLDEKISKEVKFPSKPMEYSSKLYLPDEFGDEDEEDEFESDFDDDEEEVEGEEELLEIKKKQRKKEEDGMGKVEDLTWGELLKRIEKEVVQMGKVVDIVGLFIEDTRAFFLD